MEILEARIYVGTYGKYNSGSIDGAWLNLIDYYSEREFYEACKELHKNEHDPEFMFQDWENIPEALISESWISEEFWSIANRIESENLNSEAFCDFIDLLGYEMNETAIDSFMENYQGEFGKIEHYAEHLAHELGYFTTLEENGINASYFDVGAFATDLEHEVTISENGHVFTSY